VAAPEGARLHVRLVLDEHLPPEIARQLKDRGFDVVAAADVGLLRQPDEAVFQWAIDNARAVVTSNIRDYRMLHTWLLSRGERHHGLVLVSRRHPNSTAGTGRLVGALADLLVSMSPDQDLQSGEYWL